MSDHVALARGVPAPEMLPARELGRLISRALEHDATRILSYGDGAGYPPLRALLASKHDVDPARVVITNGSLQALEFVAQRVFADFDQPRAIVEAPTYDRALLVLGRTGAEIRTANMRAEGVDVQQVAQHTRDGAQLAYVIPSFQNPAAATLGDDDRTFLAQLVQETELLLIEDDPYGDLYFDTAPPESIFSRAPDSSIAFASSFSKTVSPGVRVGYMIVPESMAGEITALANNTYISPNMIGEAAVYEMMQSEALQQNIERCRALLRERCDAMCAALDEHMPDAQYERPQGGYFLWMRLPGGVSADELLPAATEHGVTFVPGSAFGEGFEQYARLAFSYPKPDRIAVGIERLSRALHSVAASTTS